MPVFRDAEIQYLKSQHLGRLATVGADGTPHVVPVGFRLSDDASSIEIGGMGLGNSKKWRDLQSRPRAAFVVDDVSTTTRTTPRGIEIRGTVELHDTGGERFGPGRDEVWIQLIPERVVSWGVDGPAYSPQGRNAS